MFKGKILNFAERSRVCDVCEANMGGATVGSTTAYTLLCVVNFLIICFFRSPFNRWGGVKHYGKRGQRGTKGMPVRLWRECPL